MTSGETGVGIHSISQVSQIILSASYNSSLIRYRVMLRRTNRQRALRKSRGKSFERVTPRNKEAKDLSRG